MRAICLEGPWNSVSRCLPPGRRARRRLPDRPVAGEPQAGPDQCPGAAGRDVAGTVKRAGRIADGLLPLTSSAQELRAVVSAFHDAARDAGRDPADLTVVNQAAWPTPVTREPIGDGRPFLGGSPRQIAEDLMVAREIGVTQVYLAGGQGLGLDVGVDAADLDQWLGLLGEVIEAADLLGVLAP